MTTPSGDFLRGDNAMMLVSDDEALASRVEVMKQDSDVRVVRITGAECNEKNRLFDEFAAKLDFPDYFGRNWDAFEECLTDHVLGSPGTLVIFVSRARDVLSDDRTEMATFSSIIKDTIATSRGRMWFIAHTTPADRIETRARFAAAGLPLEELELRGDA